MNEQIQLLELSLLDVDTRKDIQKIKKLIANDFFEFGSGGKVYTKTDIIHRLPTESKREFEVTYFNTVTLADNCVLVTYHLQEKDNKSLRSSIWKKFESDWEIIFHQGTVVNEKEK